MRSLFFRESGPRLLGSTFRFSPSRLPRRETKTCHACWVDQSHGKDEEKKAVQLPCSRDTEAYTRARSAPVSRRVNVFHWSAASAANPAGKGKWVDVADLPPEHEHHLEDLDSLGGLRGGRASGDL